MFTICSLSDRQIADASTQYRFESVTGYVDFAILDGELCAHTWQCPKEGRKFLQALENLAEKVGLRLVVPNIVESCTSAYFDNIWVCADTGMGQLSEKNMWSMGKTRSNNSCHRRTNKYVPEIQERGKAGMNILKELLNKILDAKVGLPEGKCWNCGGFIFNIKTRFGDMGLCVNCYTSYKEGIESITIKYSEQIQVQCQNCGNITVCRDRGIEIFKTNKTALCCGTPNYSYYFEEQVK